MSLNDYKYLSLSFLILMLYSCYDNPYKQGERIYNDLCSNCHMSDGSGLVGIIPSLSERIPVLNQGHQICLLQNGINADSIGETMKVMPQFANMTDINMVNLVNFINKSWNPNFKEMTVQDLKIKRQECINIKGYNK